MSQCQRCGAPLRNHVRLYFGLEEEELSKVSMFGMHVLCDSCIEALHDQLRQLMETWEAVP